LLNKTKTVLRIWYMMSLSNVTDVYYHKKERKERREKKKEAKKKKQKII